MMSVVRLISVTAFAIAFTLVSALTPTVVGSWTEQVSRTTTVTIMELPAASVSIKITPQSLNPKSEGEPLDAMIFYASNGCPSGGVVLSTIKLWVPGNSTPAKAVSQVSNNQNHAKVRFDRQEVIGLIGNYQGSTITLEVRGKDVNGCEFVGTDTIGYHPAKGGSVSVLSGESETVAEEPAPAPPPVDDASGAEPTATVEPTTEPTVAATVEPTTEPTVVSTTEAEPSPTEPAVEEPNTTDTSTLETP